MLSITIIINNSNLKSEIRHEMDIALGQHLIEELIAGDYAVHHYQTKFQGSIQIGSHFIPISIDLSPILKPPTLPANSDQNGEDSPAERCSTPFGHIEKNTFDKQTCPRCGQKDCDNFMLIQSNCDLNRTACQQTLFGMSDPELIGHQSCPECGRSICKPFKERIQSIINEGQKSDG